MQKELNQLQKTAELSNTLACKWLHVLHTNECFRIVAVSGGLITVTGYLLTWASITHRLPSPYWLMFIWQLVISHGQIWLDTATLCPSMLNFRANQGAVSGIFCFQHFKLKCLHPVLEPWPEALPLQSRSEVFWRETSVRKRSRSIANQQHMCHQRRKPIFLQ